MRAGTQTLIQALQALPWMTDDNEDDGQEGSGSGESDSDNESRPRRELYDIPHHPSAGTEGE